MCQKVCNKKYRADSKKLQGERKNFHGARKICLGDNWGDVPESGGDDQKKLHYFALFLYDKKEFGACFREN